MKRLVHVVLLAVLVAAVGCSTSSRAFVEEQSGYAVTKGRIIQVQNLNATELEPLSDGVAVKLSQPGCKVQIRFPDYETKMLDLGQGVILVYGYEHDYVLQTATGEPAR